MGNPTVFDGHQSTAVTTENLRGKNGPIPPVLKGDGSIFVSIPTYRDGERCAETLKSIFENAKNPDKVVVGVVEQNTPEDKFCIELYCKSFGITTMKREEVRPEVIKIVVVPEERDKCPRINQIRHVAFHNINSKGPIYARSLARKVLGNEEFCMQIDAHTVFAKDWDEILQSEWKSTQNEFGVISTVPPASSDKEAYAAGGSKATEVPRMCRIKIRDNGFPDYDSPADGYATELEKPLLSHGWSAAFSFAKCHLEESAPYDAFAWYAKPIEQFSRFARMWTRGYDVYTPTKNVVFHDYEAQPNGHGLDEWYKQRRDRFRKMAINRVKSIMQIPTEEETSEVDQANLGIYGLGKRRSLQQLADFANIDLPNQKGNNGAHIKCSGHEWVPYDANISPVDNLFDNPNNLEPQPEYPLRTALTYYEQVEEELPLVEFDVNGEANPVAVKQADGFEVSHPVDGTASLPPASTLFILWVFGLIVWCLMFMNPSATKKIVSKRKKAMSNKDV